MSQTLKPKLTIAMYLFKNREILVKISRTSLILIPIYFIYDQIYTITLNHTYHYAMEYLIHSFLITALVVLWSLFLVWKYNHPLAQVSGFVLMYWPVDMSLNRSDAQQITQLVMSYEQKKISSLFVFTTVIIQYGTPNNAYQTGQSITLILTAVLTFIILKEFDKSTFSEDLREKLSEYEPNFDDLKDAVKEKVEEKIKFI